MSHRRGEAAVLAPAFRRRDTHPVAQWLHKLGPRLEIGRPMECGSQRVAELTVYPWISLRGRTDIVSRCRRISWFVSVKSSSLKNESATSRHSRQFMTPRFSVS